MEVQVSVSSGKYDVVSSGMIIAFTICVLLVVVGIICTWTGQDKWDTIIAGIMTTVGYIFGRNSKN